jgi:hypothetical protein
MKKLLFVTLFFLSLYAPRVAAQGGDSTLLKVSGAQYDSLLQELRGLLDSLIVPRSYVNISLGAGNGYFVSKNNLSTSVTASHKVIYTPGLAYFHKSGLNISATAFAYFDSGKLDFYQYVLNPGFDYIKNKNFSVGVSLVKYFNKASTAYYNNPVQTELTGYVDYKKLWFTPGISFSKGWGSYSETYDIRAFFRDTVYRFEYSYKVRDFALFFSIRHDFEWEGLFDRNDNLTVTPTLMLITGRQKVDGTVTRSTGIKGRNGQLTVFATRNSEVKDYSPFQPQSLASFLSMDYSIGKFYLQPQLYFDYRLQKPTDGSSRLNTVLSVTAGVSF